MLRWKGIFLQFHFLVEIQTFSAIGKHESLVSINILTGCHSWCKNSIQHFEVGFSSEICNSDAQANTVIVRIETKTQYLSNAASLVQIGCETAENEAKEKMGKFSENIQDFPEKWNWFCGSALHCKTSITRVYDCSFDRFVF